MIRRGLLAACVAGTLLPAPATAQHGGGEGAHAAPAVTVAMGFSAFSPRRLDVLAGTAVTWVNDSVRIHTVTAVDEAWDSGRIAIGGRYSRRLATPGQLAYYCRLHTFGGEIGVHRLLLDAPGPPGGPRRARSLRGRAALPAGTELRIEADTGSGFAALASTTVASDGTVLLEVAPAVTTRYRAVAGQDASPPVAVSVLDRRVTVATRRYDTATDVDATVRPVAPGTPAILQLYLPHRFGWWPVAGTRLDRRSHARFRLARSGSARARVVLTLEDRATVIASSRTFTVGRARAQ